MGALREEDTSAPSADTSPVAVVTHDFSASTRFVPDSSGTGALTYNEYGLLLSTGATGGSFASIQSPVASTFRPFAGNPKASFTVQLSTSPASNGPTYYCGIGYVFVSGSTFNFTQPHMGFKIIRESGANNLYATVGDDTTESVSAVLTTVASADTLQLIVTVTSGTSADFYYRKNNGTLSSATTISTNIPASSDDGGEGLFGAGVSNISVAATLAIRQHCFSYQR